MASRLKVRIKVMHPVVCLKSRIVNMLHPATRRTDRIARTQAEAAIVIVQRFISDALDDPDGWKDAQNCFREIFRYLRSDEYVKLADIKISVDPLKILRAFADNERIDRRLAASSFGGRTRLEGHPKPTLARPSFLNIIMTEWFGHFMPAGRPGVRRIYRNQNSHLGESGKSLLGF